MKHAEIKEIQYTSTMRYLMYVRIGKWQGFIAIYSKTVQDVLWGKQSQQEIEGGDCLQQESTLNRKFASRYTKIVQSLKKFIYKEIIKEINKQRFTVEYCPLTIPAGSTEERNFLSDYVSCKALTSR